MTYKSDIVGWMTPHELGVLESWTLPLLANSVIVEVGSFYGRSACCFAASAPTSSIFCFDMWRNDIEQPIGDSLITYEARIENNFPLPGMINSVDNFLHNTRLFKNINHKQIQSSNDILWDGTLIDMLFIDAEHKNPSDWEYISYFVPFMKPGGFIVGHDYYLRDNPNGNFPDIIENVQLLERMFSCSVETAPGSSLWRIRT
jgi:predicted O-methyltransferase YrrM